MTQENSVAGASARKDEGTTVAASVLPPTAAALGLQTPATEIWPPLPDELRAFAKSCRPEGMRYVSADEVSMLNECADALFAETSELFCRFCLRSERDVFLVRGPKKVCICDRCADLASEVAKLQKAEK